MVDSKIHNTTFSFACENSECGKHYDDEDFAQVFMLWGCIYLTNGEQSLIGLTCPDCWHTTLRKSPIGTPVSSTVVMEWKDGSIHYRSQDNFGGCFVPFSPKILADLSLLTPSVT
jgi:hypothetical protein